MSAVSVLNGGSGRGVRSGIRTGNCVGYGHASMVVYRPSEEVFVGDPCACSCGGSEPEAAEVATYENRADIGLIIGHDTVTSASDVFAYDVGRLFMSYGGDGESGCSSIPTGHGSCGTVSTG